MRRSGSLAICAIVAAAGGCSSERLAIGPLQQVSSVAECEPKLRGFSHFVDENKTNRNNRLFYTALGGEAHKLRTLYPHCREHIDLIARKATESPIIKVKSAAHQKAQPISVVRDQPTLPAWDAARPTKPPRMSKPPLTPSELFKKASPSVYAVRVAREDNPAVFSQGSAVAISPQEAITNCHIVLHAKVITLANGAITLAAKVSSADGASDRCYLRVLDGTLEPVVGLRDYDSLAVGEAVYTIGSPKGLDKTLGQGLLSGLRKVENIEYIQITAPVSEGSSGGGLFDDRANLIGITTFTIRDSQNLNFAIAASEYWR